MTITVPEELARQAQAAGLSIEAYVEQWAQQVVNLDERESFNAKAKNLVELFAPIRGLLTDEEVDTKFTRTSSQSRPINLL